MANYSHEYAKQEYDKTYEPVFNFIDDFFGVPREVNEALESYKEDKAS